MKISSRWIILAALLPMIGSAQVRIETAGGFVSSSFARDIGGRTAGLYGSNVTALKSGVFLSSGATNAIIGAFPTASGAFNSIAMALSNAPAVTVAFFIKFATVNNADQYNNLILATRISSAAFSGQSILCTSNKVLIGARSVASDAFQELVSPAVTMTGRWVYVVVVFNYAAGTQQIYLNGALATNAVATFGSTTFKPSPNTLAAYHDTLLCDSFTRTRACNAQISPVLIVGRAWVLADVLDDFRRRGKDFFNP